MKKNGWSTVSGLLGAMLVISVGVVFFNGKKLSTDDREGPTPPDKALATFQVEPGFQIELMASEPLIASPVDMD
jgi:hypothetical protein